MAVVVPVVFSGKKKKKHRGVWGSGYHPAKIEFRGKKYKLYHVHPTKGGAKDLVRRLRNWGYPVTYKKEPKRKKKPSWGIYIRYS